MSLACTALAVPGRLAGVTARFAPGRVTAICGPNGAGKSTLLAALAGLLPATGAVVLDGQPLAALPSACRAQAIGYLPQSGDIAWDLSVETLVSLGRLPWRGAPAPEAAAAIDAAIATLDLEPLRHRPLSRLSGGERARALVARVLAGRPRWLLADEPLASLDLAHAAALMAALKAEAARGTGVVVVLHDLAMAMNHADQVLVLDRGAVAAAGDPAQALAETVLARVWQVAVRWHGPPQARALALDARPA
ncbi:MAG: ABC transporter ATP-binding protein [Sphingomonadales bacterium]|nr:ABC transporter ATP-binding protein [Sphingomonadales bacterium]